MKMCKFFILYFCILTIDLIAISNVADQRFLDNSDQFSEQHGVKIYSGTSQVDQGNIISPGTDIINVTVPDVNYVEPAATSVLMIDNSLNAEFVETSTNYKDPNQVPVVKSSKDIKKNGKNKFGMTFSDMAQSAKKAKTSFSKVSNDDQKKSSFGFTFSDMAKVAQKKVTANRQTENE